MPTRRFVIDGHVQGVWYRGWTVDMARTLGLTGWVRNRRDGSVEAMVTGDTAAIEQFATLAEDGPPAARVDRIDASDAPDADFNGFEQRPTT